MEEMKVTSPSPRELLTAAAMYPIAYIYTLIASGNDRLWFGVFVLLFVLAAEYIFRGTPAPGESWVWLGCAAVMTLCVVFGWGRVWNYGLTILFVHALSLWWVLCRSGKLLEGESGHLLPADVLNGLFRIPFGNFSLRIRCVGQGIRSMRRGGEEGKRSVLPAALALVLGTLLLYWATASLAAADPGFNGIMAGILHFFTPEDTESLWEFAMRFLVSLPVGAWLFGLIAGSARTPRGKLCDQAQRITASLARLRVVPERVWTVCAAAFAAVYLLFFAVQGSYLFGAFTRSLPEGFTVAEYARQGFFELCRVMGINFALLWLMTRTGTRPAAGSRALRVMCTLLLSAGMLLAVVAISKLALYISCFGFTPRRLQSTWLALLLLLGSAAAMYSLWTGKKSFRPWLIFAAVSLTLLHLY